MTLFEYHKISDLNQLENEWRNLESGSDMTYFQTYDWYRSLLADIPVDCERYESRFVVLRKDGEVKAIAPIWVIKRNFGFVNKKGIYLLGHGGWCDYLNFIYKDTSADDLLYLLKDISLHYGINYFGFDDVPESSLLYKTIVNSLPILQDSKSTCIKLELPSTLEQYDSMLSKNTRQNLRTAANRIQKAGLTISFNFDDRTVDKKICEELREIRLPKKQGNYDILRRLKIALIDRLHHKFHFRLPFYADDNYHIMTAFINDELAAYFNYGIDVSHKRIVLMAVGTSEKYSWYSPGMLLMRAFINYKFQLQDIEVIDFTRGNEKYKYSLGGQEHYNHHLIFKCK